MRLIIYVMLLLYPFSLLPAASGGKKEKNLSDEELMTLVQKQTFRYFWDYDIRFRAWHANVVTVMTILLPLVVPALG